MSILQIASTNGSFAVQMDYTSNASQATDVPVSILLCACACECPWTVTTHGSFVGINIANTFILGSMADVPKDLLATITKLQEQFKVPTEKLKEITEHFVSELEKGENSSKRTILTALTKTKVYRLKGVVSYVSSMCYHIIANLIQANEPDLVYGFPNW